MQANVARFSLYLTLLDYVDNTGIDALHALAKPSRVFPALTDNVLANDVFTINTGNATDIGRFTHVIQQFLRHARLQTTAIYTKVDYDTLRTIARPWPGGAA